MAVRRPFSSLPVNLMLIYSFDCFIGWSEAVQRALI